MIDIIKIDTIRNNKYFNNEKNKPAKKNCLIQLHIIL